MTQFSDLLLLSSERLLVLQSVSNDKFDEKITLHDAKQRAIALALTPPIYKDFPGSGLSVTARTSSKEDTNSRNLAPPLSEIPSLCEDLEQLNIYRHLGPVHPVGDLDVQGHIENEIENRILLSMEETKLKTSLDADDFVELNVNKSWEKEKKKWMKAFTLIPSVQRYISSSLPSSPGSLQQIETTE